MKPHLLYIAFWFPPSRASGVYRALATTERFVEAGWRVTVITVDTPFLNDEVGSTDPSLLDQIPHGIAVKRVLFTLSIAASLDIRRLGWFRASFPTVWQKSERFLESRQSRRRSGAPEHFPDKYKMWIQPSVDAGLEINEETPITHILATGNPYSSFEIARLLSNELEVPFSVDFRDPWSIDVFTGEDAGANTARAEEIIVTQAEHCFHVNEAIAQAYRDKYPHEASKQRVAPNGFDVKSIPAPSGPTSGPLRFGILGTLTDRWPMEPILRAWSAERVELPEGSELVLGGHLGYFEHSSETLRTLLTDGAQGFRYVGPVDKNQVAEFYRSLDVVVVPVPEGNMVTSGKVYEALAVGKPFVVVQEETGGARVLTSGHRLAFGTSPDVDEIRSAFTRAAARAQDLDVLESETAQLEAEIYERARSLDLIVRAVTQSTSRPSSG